MFELKLWEKRGWDLSELLVLSWFLGRQGAKRERSRDKTGGRKGEEARRQGKKDSA